MTELSLDLSQFGVSCTCSRFIREEQLFGDLRLSLVSKFVTEKQDPYVYQVPKNWFEHLKQSVAPKWFLRRWPVKTDRHEVSVKTVYPFLKTQIPPELQGRFVCVLFNDTNVNSFLSDTEGIDRMEWRKQAKEKMMSSQLSDFMKCHCCGRAWIEK